MSDAWWHFVLAWMAGLKHWHVQLTVNLGTRAWVSTLDEISAWIQVKMRSINCLLLFFKVKLSKWAKTKLPKIWVSWLYRIIMSSNIRETTLSWNCKGKVFCKISFLYYFKFCICNSHREMLLFFFLRLNENVLCLLFQTFYRI